MNLLRPLRSFNWLALLFMVALMVVGVFYVYSANAFREVKELRELYLAHAELGAVGIGIGFLLAFIDYRPILKYSWVLYLGSLLLLVAVLVVGTERMGARRWVFGIQPAEFAKLATILLLSAFLGREDARKDIWDFMGAGLITLVPMALILRQPDLGTALVFAPVLLALLFVSWTSPRALFSCILAGALAVAVLLGSVAIRGNPDAPAPARRAAHAATCVLSDYQVGRLLDFVYPDRDPINRGWNRRQSQIAIGSGGAWGKGFLKGDQNILGYLPQQVSANDFIFSVLAEEKGFAGSIFVLLCFGGLLLSTLYAAAVCADAPGRLLCTGVAALLFSHVFVNVGMTVGLLPVTGLPLPFISYGRTFMLTATIAMGLVQSVSVHASRREAAQAPDGPALRP